MQTGIAVRAAAPPDAPQMAALHLRAWRATYAGILPEAFLAGLQAADREAMWQRSLTPPELAPAERVILVAEADGALVGLAAAGHARGDDEHGLGELYSIHVDPSAWGQGAGRALLAALEERARASGPRLMWCNARVPAAPFYERLGWSIVSERFEIPTAGPHVKMNKRV